MTTALYTSCISQKVRKSLPDGHTVKSLEISVHLEYLSANTRTHYFPCSDFKVSDTKLEQQSCGDESLKKYIDANLNKTDLCNLKGTIVIEFDIRKDGNIGNVCLIQCIGSSCGEMISEILYKMPVWTLDIPRHKQYFEDYRLYVEFK